MRADLLIDYLIYIVFTAGSVFLMWPLFNLAIQRYKLRHRLKKSLKGPELPKPLDYFYKLISVSFEKESSAYMFLCLEFAVFVVSWILSCRNYGPLAALIIASCSFAIPMVFLIVKLEKERTRASYEGISLVSELLRQYRICRFNIYEAMEKTIRAEGNYKLSSKRLFSLLVRMRSACGENELNRAFERFAFSYQTSWARMLAQCIRIAAVEGSDVSGGFADIARQLKESSDMLEKRKLLNSEATRMTLLMVPLMYIISMFISVVYLGVSPAKLLANQFLNPTAYMLFLISCFLFLVNLLLISMLSGFRLDY